MTAEQALILREELERLNLSDPDRALLWSYICGEEDPESHPACQDWKRQCYNWPPAHSEMVLCAANRMLGGFGDEPIRDHDFWDSYHCDIRAAYVNLGDIYATTLLVDHDSGEFMVMSWGDFVEAEEIQDP